MYGPVRNKTRRLCMQALSGAGTGMPMNYHLMACSSAFPAECRVTIVIGNCKSQGFRQPWKEHSHFVDSGSSQLRADVP